MENNEKNTGVYEEFPDWTTKDTVLCCVTWLSLLGGLFSILTAITGGHPYPFTDPRCEPDMPTIPGNPWIWGIAGVMLILIFANTAGWRTPEEEKGVKIK